MSNQSLRIARLLSLVFLSLPMPQALAASFQLLEQSASHLGTSFSGTAATANEASTAYYNPAGMTRLRGHNAQLSTIGILPNIKLHATSATATVPLAGQNLGPANARVRGKAIIPTFHYVYAPENRMAFGLGLNSPFGLISKYHDNSVARYLATGSSLKAINVGPSVAYRVTDEVSVGGGFDYINARIKLDTAAGEDTLPGQPANPNGSFNVHAKGHGFGWHLGGLWSQEDTRMGLNYRSQVNLKAGGHQLFHVTLPGYGGLVISNYLPVHSRIKLPQSLTYSISQRVNDDWTALSDVQWTNWKKFDRLVIVNSQGTTFTTPENYRDTYRISLGGIYCKDNQISYRGGIAFDKSPTRPEFRTARIPDSDRFWLSVGARYRLTRGLVVDAGLAHIFFKKAPMSENPPQAGGPGAAGYSNMATMKGTYKGSANVVGIQLSWNPV